MLVTPPEKVGIQSVFDFVLLSPRNTISTLSMSHILVEIVDHSDQLTPCLEFWARHAPTPLQSPEWLLAWWSAFESPGTKLCVVVVRNDDHQIIGLAPFYLRDNWTEGRSLRFLGSGRACSDFQTILSAPGQSATVGQAIGHWLLANRTALNWSLLELEGVTDNEVALNALTEQLRIGRCTQQVTELENTWRLDVTRGWSGFHAGMSKTQRRQTRNLVNRFDKRDDWQVRVVRDSAEWRWALAVCVDLHQRRWQSSGQPGCFADQRFHRFIALACEKMISQQAISFAVLEECGIPIACHLYLHDAAGNRYMYQSGRDPNREDECIGRILNAVSVRDACDAGIAFIDFLRGDEIYKHRLGALPSRCLRLRIVPPAMLPQLRQGARTISRNIKQRFERLRQTRSSSRTIHSETTEQSISHSDSEA